MASDHSDDIMIAFLPTSASWVKQDLPHLTLVYAGETRLYTPSDKRAMLGLTFVIARSTPPFSLDAMGLDVFGDDEKVDVLRLKKNDVLNRSRRMADKWNQSKHPNFNPHVTIGPEGSADPKRVPSKVSFDRVGLFWGDAQLVYNLS